MFGAELAVLVDEDTMIPTVIEKLLITLELRALFVEGLYRKTGSVAQVRQLRKVIETTPSSQKTDLAIYCKFITDFQSQTSTHSRSKIRPYTS